MEILLKYVDKDKNEVKICGYKYRDIYYSLSNIFQNLFSRNRLEEVVYVLKQTDFGVLLFEQVLSDNLILALEYYNSYLDNIDDNIYLRLIRECLLKNGINNYEISL